MKKLFILLVINPLLMLHAQNPNIKRTWHWYFGDHAGIDFSSGTAMADTNGALVTNEGCASISDTAGNLQFYSDGRTVWNRNHQIMPHGTGLMGGANGSSTQQVLIIPKPFSPNLYYLFTTDETGNLGANGMRYSVIDMNLDGGLGDLDIPQKNILLFAPCTEKLAAVNHCSDTSVWVMGHEVNNNHFRAYLITANGIDTNSVVSAVGFPNMSNVADALAGPLKFSSDGNWACSVTDTNCQLIELFSFDSNTGLLNNPIVLSTHDAYTLALSFSNDNSKLYAGKMFHQLFQYDLSSMDSSVIVNSKTVIADTIGFRYMQNNCLGEIYCAKGFNDTVIMTIQFPNILGIGCSLNFNSLNVSNVVKGGFSAFNESYFRLIPNSSCNTGILEVDNHIVTVFPNPAFDWITIRRKEIKQIQLINILGNILFDERAVNFSS